MGVIVAETTRSRYRINEKLPFKGRMACALYVDNVSASM